MTAAVHCRQTAAGDQLRVTYEQLSKDPNSLSNLDQDLPNYAQHSVPIYSLPMVRPSEPVPDCPSAPAFFLSHQSVRKQRTVPTGVAQGEACQAAAPAPNKTSTTTVTWSVLW